MTLDYRASNIATAERLTGKRFFKVFSSLNGDNFSVDDLLFIWQCGGGDDASFDDAFKQGIPAVMETIMEGINDAGFLGTKVDTKELRKAMEQAQTQALQSSGANS